jgi:hypothetical protein
MPLLLSLAKRTYVLYNHTGANLTPKTRPPNLSMSAPLTSILPLCHSRPYARTAPFTSAASCPAKSCESPGRSHGINFRPISSLTCAPSNRLHSQMCRDFYPKIIDFELFRAGGHYFIRQAPPVQPTRVHAAGVWVQRSIRTSFEPSRGQGTSAYS